MPKWCFVGPFLINTTNFISKKWATPDLAFYVN